MAQPFIDTATIEVVAGGGGNGCASFYRDLFMRYRRPDGGPGGAGGDVVVVADSQLMTLLDAQYRKRFAAGRGRHGSSKGKTGAGGAACHIPVPVGTVIRDADTREVLADLDQPGASVVAARGGSGGRGNEGKPYQAMPGEPGEQRRLFLELKVLADVGLVGLPNAGKSSVLAKISTARPKIASYPFTTLHPVLGVVMDDEERRFTVCDIPGLIEGAHQGRGLGLDFLRHIERTKILVQVIDMAGSEGRQPEEDYATVLHELRQHHPQLLEKPRLIAANKMDLDGAREQLARFRAHVSEVVYPVSCQTGEGLPALIQGIRERLST